MGRKSGSSALDPDPRELSKKQRRRKVRLAELRALSKDPKKEKLRMSFLKKQFDSPEMKAFVERTKLSVAEGLKELMLPDGLVQQQQQQQNTLDSGGARIRLVDKRVDPTETLLQLQMWTSSIEDQVRQKEQQLKAGTEGEKEEGELTATSAIAASDTRSQSSALATTTTTTTFELDPSVLPVTALEANRALTMFVERGAADDAEETLLLMKLCGIPTQPVVFTHSMATHSRRGNHAAAVKLFDSMLAVGVEPDSFAWTALIHAQARGGDTKKAMQTLDRLKQFSIATTPMYTAVLSALVRARNHAEAGALWERMHCEPGLQLSLESFTVMLTLCSQTREVERAFFLLDELKSKGLEPDVAVFVALIRACSGAPHWVNGYQNTIFDALAAMEGAELVPTTEVYNALIYAFGKAGDAAAAEFYFFEMRAKGVEQDVVTYNALLDAYAKSSSVGARHYGTRGRWVRPPERPKTEEERLHLQLGGDRVTEAMSKGLWQEEGLERGKRQRGQLEDLADDPEDEGELRGHLQFLAAQAQAQTQQGRADENDEGELCEEDEEGEEGEDEEMRALMAGLSEKDRRDLQSLVGGIEEEERQERRRLQSLISPNQGDEDEQDDEEKIKGQAQGQGQGQGANEPSSSSSAALWRAASFEEFTDPFLSSRPLRPSESAAQKQGQEEGGEGEEGEVDDGKMLQNLISLLDGSSSSSSSLSGGMDGGGDDRRLVRGRGKGRGKDRELAAVAPPSEAEEGPDEDEAWSLVEFGRAPDPDYKEPLPVRQARLMRRAELAMVDLEQRGVPADKITLTSFLSVYAECLKDNKALSVLESFGSRRPVVEADHHTFRALSRMFVRKKDIPAALEVFEEAQRRGVGADGEFYGLLIESLTHRGMIPEALKMLERAAAASPPPRSGSSSSSSSSSSAGPVRVPERHLRMLRARCEKLGVRHPDMPPDPSAWTKDVRRLRDQAARKGTQSNRNLQQAKTWN